MRLPKIQPAKMQLPKILLTGATGFIGTNFVLQLHKKYEIIALVRQSSDISKIEQFCQIYRYDNEIESLLQDLRNFKIIGIVHLASIVPTSSNPANNFLSLVESNIIFGGYLLEIAKNLHLSFFINAATFGSYCNSLTYRPATLYAATKKAFEDIMEYYALISNCIFSNLVIFNVYGPNDTSLRIFNLLDRIAQSGEMLEMSQGDQIVDYSYVDDVVSGFDCLIELITQNPQFCKNKTFALKGKERKTLKDVILLYEKILGKKLNIKWGAREKRELEIMIPWEGGEKLPNWEQKISLEEGLRRLALL